jgi:hypothetical protein
LTKQESEKLQRELAMMRMICDTNYILDPKDRICPKLAELEKILDECRSNGDVKVIVFSEWARMLELVKGLCEKLQIGYALHTGSVPQRRRRAEIQLFKSDPKLSDLLLDLDMGDMTEYETYFDRNTNKIVSVESTMLSSVEEGDEEFLEDLDEDDEQLQIARAISNDDGSRFIAPPDKFDFNEYRLMERFIGSLDDEKAANQLYRAIDGRGAFRYFRDTLQDLGIKEKWYRFRNDAMKRFVIEWAEMNNVPFEDDARSPGK